MICRLVTNYRTWIENISYYMFRSCFDFYIIITMRHADPELVTGKTIRLITVRISYLVEFVKKLLNVLILQSGRVFGWYVTRTLMLSVSWTHTHLNTLVLCAVHVLESTSVIFAKLAAPFDLHWVWSGWCPFLPSAQLFSVCMSTWHESSTRWGPECASVTWLPCLSVVEIHTIIICKCLF